MPFRLSVTGWKKLLEATAVKKQARSIQDDLVAQAQGVSKKLHFWVSLGPHRRITLSGASSPMLKANR